jgi:hypothetical protein
MEGMLSLGEQILATQPFSLLPGSELLRRSRSGAELKIPIKAELKQSSAARA